MSGMVSFGKRLYHTMIRNGDGLMAHVSRQLNQVAHITQRVVGAHIGVQMQLHPFLIRQITAFLGLARLRSNAIMVSSRAKLSCRILPFTRNAFYFFQLALQLFDFIGFFNHLAQNGIPIIGDFKGKQLFAIF